MKEILIVTAVILIVAVVMIAIVVTMNYLPDIWDYFRFKLPSVHALNETLENSSSCTVHLKITKILNREDKEIWENSQPETDRILYILAKNRDKDFGVKAKVTDGDVEREINTEFSCFELARYLQNNPDVLKEGIDVQCRKAVLNTEHKPFYYVVYYSLLSDGSLKELKRFWTYFSREYDGDNIVAKGCAVFKFRKEKDDVIKSILSGCDDEIKHLKNHAMSDVLKPEFSYPVIEEKIAKIDACYEEGKEIRGVDREQWEGIYRNEILILLTRKLTDSHQKEVMEVLELLEQHIYSPLQEEASADTEASIEAVRKMATMNCYK